MEKLSIINKRAQAMQSPSPSLTSRLDAELHGLDIEPDLIPLILSDLSRLDLLDQRRLAIAPDTTYLFGLHAREVAQDLGAVSRALGTQEHVAQTLHYLALVHDVGKLFLPFEIWATQEKPSKDFKALRRTHGPLGAAWLTGDFDQIPRHAPAPLLPYLEGRAPLDDILPTEIRGKISWGPERWHSLKNAMDSSPFKGKKSAFLSLAVAATLRHHEPTGTKAPENQPIWLKLLALIEDLSGNMTERPHFQSAGRGTTLEEAIAHMREEGPENHDISLLDLIFQVKKTAQPQPRTALNESPGRDLESTPCR